MMDALDETALGCPERQRVHVRQHATSAVGGATGCYPGLLGLTLQAPGCATCLARAAEPLSARWEAAVRQ